MAATGEVTVKVNVEGLSFEELLEAAHAAFQREHPSLDLLICHIMVSKALIMDESAKDFLLSTVPQMMSERACDATKKRLGIE